MRYWIVAVVVAMAAGGCQTYEPQPLDLRGHAERWRRGAEDLSGTAAFVEQLGADGEAGAFDASDGLTLGEAQRVALALNAELRAARMRAKVPLAGSRHAGRWDDPELGFDVLRIVESVDKPWIGGVGLSITIPLSGRLAAEREKAWAEYSAAWRRIAIAEAETAAAVEQAWIGWSAAQRRAALLDEHASRLSELRDATDRLRAAGELATTDARLIAIEHETILTERDETSTDAARLRLALLEYLGLTPDAPIALHASIEAAEVSIDGAIDAVLLKHPRIELAKAEYEVAEQTLRREIRKQYPDLTIGPAYENEEGQSRIGLSGAIPVPLINRNRRGIAEAAAERDAKRVEAEQAYEQLAARYAAARVEHDAAAGRYARLTERVAPMIDGQLEDVRRLIDLGEVDVLRLTDAFEKAVQTRMKLLDAARDRALAAAQLRHLIEPTWIAVPAQRESKGSNP